LLEAAGDPSITLYVTSQILCEFYSLITNPRRVVVVSSPTKALGIISAMVALEVCMCCRPQRVRLLDGCNRWSVTQSPAETYSILQIVATMQANGIDQIYTVNRETSPCFPNSWS
jgi:hypothetical protein